MFFGPRQVSIVIFCGISFVAGNSVSSVEVMFSWVDPTWTVKGA